MRPDRQIRKRLIKLRAVQFRVLPDSCSGLDYQGVHCAFLSLINHRLALHHPIHEDNRLGIIARLQGGAGLKNFCGHGRINLLKTFLQLLGRRLNGRLLRATASSRYGQDCDCYRPSGRLHTPLAHNYVKTNP